MYKNPTGMSILDLKDQARVYLKLWKLPKLANLINISYSARLTKSLGRARVDSRNINLNCKLISTDEALVKEVLCHELAHIAVYEKYGPNRKPHGNEWSSLIKQAGFSPRTHISFEFSPQDNSQITPRRYSHICPICQAERIANRKLKKWRCASCAAAGLESELIIQQVTGS
jgi:predicted SprT family Zn-dependent metalloprotease